jgi:hypothetical protein
MDDQYLQIRDLEMRRARLEFRLTWANGEYADQLTQDLEIVNQRITHLRETRRRV